MRIAIFLLVLLSVSVYTTTATNPIPINLATMSLPSILWKILGKVLSWSEKEAAAGATRAALGMDGIYTEGASGDVKESTDKGKSFTAVAGTMEKYIPGLMASGYYEPVSHRFWMSMLGADAAEVPNDFGTCVDITWSMSIMGAIYAICNDDGTIAKLDLLEGDTDFVDIPFTASTPVSISVDGDGGIWVVGSDEKLYVSTDLGVAWTQKGKGGETTPPIFAVFNTLEGSTWLLAEQTTEKRKETIVQIAAAQLVHTDDTVAFLKSPDGDLEYIFAFDIIYAVAITTDGAVHVCDVFGLNALLMTVLKSVIEKMMSSM